MSLEVGNYISALDSVNPTGSDPKSRGDDHLRLIKSTLKNSFAGITGAVLVGGTNGGLINAYTLTPTPALVSYIANMTIVFSPVISNTGAATIDVSGLGPINIRSVSGAALASGELVAGQTYKAIFTGTEFRLDSITKSYVDQLAFSTALPAQTLGLLASNGTVAAFTKTFTGYAVDESKGANVASAATIDLQNTVVTGNLVHVTGTTTITAITLPAGAERTIVFDGILTLTHSASLDLPGAANITTAVGDRAIIRGEGSSVTRVISYTKANGQAVIVTPPALVLIATVVPTAAASVNFLNTFSSTYDDYLVICSGLGAGGTGNLALRFAIAGVADSANNYSYVNHSDATVASTSASSIAVCPTGSVTRNCEIYINNVNTTSAASKTVIADGIGTVNGAANPQNVEGFSGMHQGANVATGFSLIFQGGGNFTAQGVVRVYGIARV